MKIEKARKNLTFFIQMQKKNHNMDDSIIKEMKDDVKKQEELVKKLVEQCTLLATFNNIPEEEIKQTVEQLYKYYPNVSDLYEDTDEYINLTDEDDIIAVETILRVFLHIADDEDVKDYYYYYDPNSPGVLSDIEQVLHDPEITQWEGDQILGCKD